MLTLRIGDGLDCPGVGGATCIAGAGARGYSIVCFVTRIGDLPVYCPCGQSRNVMMIPAAVTAVLAIVAMP